MVLTVYIISGYGFAKNKATSLYMFVHAFFPCLSMHAYRVYIACFFLTNKLIWVKLQIVCYHLQVFLAVVGVIGCVQLARVCSECS